MLPLLSLAVLALTALDHWTTFVCLRVTVPGFAVREGNPLAAWLFEQVGLVPGLVLDSVITVAALAFLLATRRVPATAKTLLLLMIGTWTAGAVANNVRAIEALGLFS